MKNKDKLIIDRYTQPIFYPTDLYVVKNGTKKDIQDLFLWADECEVADDEVSDCGQGMTYSIMVKKDDPDKRFCVVIQLFTDNFDKSDKNSWIDVISHEANHAAFRILDHCNIKLTDDTTEVFAFMQGWITKCVYETLKKKSNE